MKLHNVANISGLFRILDNTRDNIVVETADGTRFDWKSQNGVLRSIAGNLEKTRLSQLSLCFQNKKDANDVMFFLMECNRDARQTA